jgi:tetratricopeptide (TPR) repeat protein
MNNIGKYCLLIGVCYLIIQSGYECSAQAIPVTPHELLPEQSIEVVGDDLPQWGVVWNKARKKALQGDFDEALSLYKALLVMKDNLEEARWEMVRVLMHLKRWDKAAEDLEHLIGSEPGNTLYIRSLGKVMWEMEQYERAIDLFKEIYANNPTDRMVLAGLVEGFTKLGRKGEALPYLEKLSKLDPTNRGVRRYLAFLYYDAGNYEDAKPHLTILARSDEVEIEVLQKTAKVYGHIGLDDEASVYWERLAAREPENVEAQNFLARYYEESGQPERALVYYKKYLEHYPEDRNVAKRVAFINTAINRKKAALASPEAYHAKDDSEKQSTKLLQTIGRFGKAGRYNDAIPLYRQLLELFPGDQRTIELLANDLSAIGEKEGRESMVKYVSVIASDNISIYRSVAHHLRQMELTEPLLAILHVIHELDQEDNKTTQELAILYLGMDDLPASRKFFSRLSDKSCWNLECLQARAVLSRKLNLPEHELSDNETILKIQPERYMVRQRVIKLAAEMGLLDTALYHAGYLQYMLQGKENLELKILLADAYRESGYFSRARERYLEIIRELSLDENPRGVEIRIRAWLGIAESYKELGLDYEAEQSLRIALADEKGHLNILEALYDLALDIGAIEESEIWLQALNRKLDEMGKISQLQFDLDWKRLFLKARMLTVVGDYGQAIKMNKRANSALERLGANNVDREMNAGNRSPEFAIKVNIAENLMYAGEYAEAEKIIKNLQLQYSNEPQLYVLLEQVSRESGMHSHVKRAVTTADLFAEKDFARQLALAKLYRKYGNYPRYLELSQAAVNRKNNSLSAQLHLVEAEIANGGYLDALELLRQLQLSYPDNSWLLSRQLNFFAKIGNFEEALELGDIILSENQARADVILIKAHILWEMKRWREAVKLYESVVEPPVEKIVEKKMQEQALAISPDFTTGIWWEIVTLSMGPEQTLSEIVMSPLHAVDFSDNSQTINSIAAPYYALYRWQERFIKELSVRRSVMRWEYYHAANKLEDVIEEYGKNDFLIFDLAGLYSRLDRLGDEADLYRELKKQNASFPGLEDAIQRNSLKLSPHMFLTYIMQEDDGWDGYMAVKQEIFKGGGWYFPSTNQKWSLDLARIEYESTNSELGLWAWRPMLSYDLKVNQALSLSLGGGIQDLGSGYDTSPLFSGMITGRLADEMRIVLSAKQDVTSDTIASLTRDIRRRNYKAELMFHFIPRLVFGGYHDFIDYSDSNWTKNSSFWASAILLPEPTLFKLTYNYNYYDSDEGRKPGLATADGFALEDHPYWSPQNYWTTRFSLYLKHQLSNDALARGIPSYYTIEYSLGYDSDDNDLHELKGGINIEILKSFILGGSYAYVDLDEYQHHQTMFTLMYRW